MPTGPAHNTGWNKVIEKAGGGKPQRMKWENANEGRMIKWGEEFERRIKAARPEMDALVEQGKSAGPVIRRITREVDELGIGPID